MMSVLVDFSTAMIFFTPVYPVPRCGDMIGPESFVDPQSRMVMYITIPIIGAIYSVVIAPGHQNPYAYGNRYKDRNW